MRVLIYNRVYFLQCWQVQEEKKELDDKLNKALQEINYLNLELGQRELVPRAVSTMCIITSEVTQ